MASNKYMVQLGATFDYSKVVEGINKIKQQLSSVHVGDDIAKDLQKTFDKIDLKLPKIEKLINKDDLSLREIEKLQKLIQSLQKDFENINKISSQTNFTESFSKIDLSKLENLDKQIKEIQDKVKAAREELVKTFSDKTFSTDSNAVKNAITELFSVDSSEVQNKFNDIRDTFEKQIIELEDTIRNSTDKKFESGSSIIQTFFGKDSQVKVIKGQTENFKKQVNDIIITLKNVKPGTDEAKQALRDLIDLLKNPTLVKNPNNETPFNLPTPQDLDILDKLKNNLENIEELLKSKKDFFSENDKQLSEILASRILLIEERLKSLENTQKEVTKGTDDLKDKLEDYTKELDDNVEKTKQEKIQQDALNATFGTLASRIEHAVSALAVFNKSMQIIRNAIKSVEDLDAAFTQIAIVSEQSSEQAWKMFDSFNSLAKQYSITTKDLTEGAKLFYQQGLSAADTMKMVEASTVSAALGEVTMTEAANTLTAAIQGYNESAAVAMDYTDKIAMVGAVSAADFNELSTAMEKTASSAYTAGIDFDHLLGYLGKMIEVTREAPANLGTAMKTIIARFEDMKKDPMAVLEDGVSANKVEAALATIGIALRNSEGEFRALQDVMDELGMKWQSLTRNQQAYIATVAAGSRQQSRFLALMNNYDRTLDLITESQNSAGAAAQQYATYQDSIAAAQARLTASWEKFYSKIVDNSAIKFAINGLSSLVEVLSKIPPAITAIGVSIGALQLQEILNKNGGLIKIISNSLGLTGEGESVKAIGVRLIGNLYAGLEKGAKELDSRGGGRKVIANAISKIGKDSIEANKNIEKLGKTTKTLGESLKEAGEKAKTAFRGILNFVLTPKGLGIIAVTAAIIGLTWFINNITQKANKAAEEIEKLNTEIANDKQTLKSNEDLLKSYDELIKKVNRTEEEQKQLDDIINEMEETYDNAITWMDQYGNMHLSNRDDIAAENDELRENIKLKEQEVRDKQKDFLNETPSEQWNKENLTKTGFSTSQVKKMLNAQKVSNEIKEIEDIANNLFIDESTLIDMLQEKAKELNIYDLVANLFENEEYVDEYNGAISRYYTHSVDEIVKGMSNAISEGKNTVESVTEEFLHSIDIDELFSKYNIDSKHSAIISYFKMIVSSLPIEQFNASEEEIEKIILKLLSITDNDELIENFDLLKQFYNQEITAEDTTKLNELGELIGKDVIDGYLQSLVDKKDEIRKNTIQAVEDALGIKLSENAYEGLDETQLQTRSDLAGTIQGKGYTGQSGQIILGQSAYYGDKINDLVKTSVDDGTYEGYIQGRDKISAELENDTTITDATKDLVGQLLEDADQQIEDANLFSKVFDNAQTKVQELVSNYKESMDSVLGGEYTKLSDTDMTSSDNGVFIDPESGELMISVTKTLADLEQKRALASFEVAKAYTDVSNKLKILDSKQKNLLKEGKDLTEEEKTQVNQLENQKRILEQQATLLNKMKLDGAQAGWATSINLAKDYQSNLKSILSIQKSIKEQGFLDISDMETILNMAPQYAQYFEEIGNTIAGVEEKIYTITEENIENIMKAEKEKYDYKLALQQRDAAIEYEQAVKDYQYLVETYGKEIGLDDTKVQETIKNRKKELNATKASAEGAIKAHEDGATGELEVQAEKDNEMVNLFRAALEEMSLNYEQFLKAINSGENIKFDGIYDALKGKQVEVGAKVNVNWDDLYGDEGSEDRKALIQAMIEDARAKMETAWQKLQSLKSIDVPGIEKLKSDLEASGKGAEDLEKAMEEVAKAIEKCTDALKDLDDLLKDIRRDLKDITIDYNPFTDLFEAWEAEWDYYYNIKNLIKQLDTQSTFIDNVISADYASAQEKLNAYDAKVGNITGKIAANDAYITTLRAGIAKQAKEFESEFNQYYNVDNRMGGWQIFQRDTTLSDWEKTINEVKKYSFELSKLINTQENELNLLEANQQALEQERSAYESILSTVDSLIDSLGNNEDITVDLSELEGIKVELQAAIDDESVENIKEQVRNLNDYIQELNIKLDLNDNVVEKGLEEGYERLKDEIDDLQDLIDTLNEKIAEQQELLQQLSEIYNMYVDTAIDTQQELYDAIVEQYQDEINEKKKHYDYLKQLDNDYLKAVKDNINKERKVREDANKQQDFQKNLQRAQLLQQDTSGAYRNELANLNKEIENQRQDLYDDLVDKQVEALEKEIEKRHELYDLEVSAMEERLAYMQENAILLWEMVNDIVAGGANEMMATLENTTNYINQNELAKERQRRQWELNTQATYKGVIEGEINMLQRRIDKAKEELDAYEELQNAIELSTATYSESQAILQQENADFQQVMNEFMQNWTTMTSDLTGYNESWAVTLSNIKTAMEKDIQALDAMGDEGGSIFLLNNKLKQLANEMYDEFIEERRRYKESLTSTVNNIEAEITAAINKVADKISNIKITPPTIQLNKDNVGNGGTNFASGTNSTDSNGNKTSTEIEKRTRYKVTVTSYNTYKDYANERNGESEGTLGGYNTPEEARSAGAIEVQKLKKLYPNKYFIVSSAMAYKHGGFADFTGPAWLDGTKSEPEAVLNAKQTKLFTSMVSSLERTTANNSNINSALGSSYNIGDINTNINVEKLDNETDIDRVARQVENRIMKSIRNRVVVSVA